MRSKLAFIICVLLHGYILYNVYRADQLTPRILACPKYSAPSFS
jgi:hypothetical protein